MTFSKIKFHMHGWWNSSVFCSKLSSELRETYSNHFHTSLAFPYRIWKEEIGGESKMFAFEIFKKKKGNFHFKLLMSSGDFYTHTPGKGPWSSENCISKALDWTILKLPQHHCIGSWIKWANKCKGIKTVPGKL